MDFRSMLGFALFSAALLGCTHGDAMVVVNATELSAAELETHSAKLGYRIPDGRYWYDARTGAWGLEGQGTAGIAVAGLSLGGPLRADASLGRSGVFVNGRELAASDISAFARMGIPAYPGRYWVDAAGNGGLEGMPASFNLFMIARQAAAAGLAPDSIYARSGSGDNRSSTWIGGDGSLSHSTTVNGKTYDYYIGD